MLDRIAARRPERVRRGIPAHVSLLYPFVDAVQVTPDLVARLTEDCAGVRGLPVRFARAEARPGIVLTGPEPAGPLAAVARRLWAGWPEHPPYGGQYGPEPDLHVTLALGGSAGIAREAGRGLPVECVLGAAWLVELTAGGWRPRAELG